MLKLTRTLLVAVCLVGGASAARKTRGTSGLRSGLGSRRGLMTGGSGNMGGESMGMMYSHTDDYSDSSDECKYKVMETAWEDIKLTGDNEVAPFTGVDFAFGTAVVTLMAADTNMCEGPVKYLACIDVDIEGFAPAAMHIHRAPINENGDVAVDFTGILMPFKSDYNDCVVVENELLFTALIEEPEMYYVNAHLGGDQPTILQSVRGQLVQSFTAKLENAQTVAPFNIAASDDATGMAKVTFEAAGTIACFDVTISDFDPALGHVHMAARGTNGPRIFNYSSTKVGPGRFFGCMTLEELGVTMEEILNILKNPEMYYFDYHLTSEEPTIFTSIRGQLPMN